MNAATANKGMSDTQTAPGEARIKRSIMAEKLNTFSSSTYVQMGTVVSIILLTAFLISSKVNTEADVRRLDADQKRMESRFEKLENSVPTKSEINLQFQNVVLQLEGIKAELKRK